MMTPTDIPSIGWRFQKTWPRRGNLGRPAEAKYHAQYKDVKRQLCFNPSSREEDSGLKDSVQSNLYLKTVSPRYTQNDVPYSAGD